jgi:hypothetical protein
MQIKITKLSEETIRIERIADDGTSDIREYPANFRAYGEEKENLVSVKEREGPFTAFSVHYSELEINGEIPPSREEAVIALNDFIGNFKFGGASPLTTDVVLSVTQAGINGEVTPSIFSWITDLEISEVRLMSNAAGISFRIGEESYDKDTLAGVQLPAGGELSLTGIDIEAGNNQANGIIIFKKIKIKS